jgi:hypothetical protein
MAAATITNTTYGYKATGGTDATSITTSIIRVKNFVFIPATNADTAALTDKVGTSVHAMKGATAGTSYNDFFGDMGTRFDGLKVTLSGANDVLYVHSV